MNKTQEFEEIITKLSDLKTQYNLEKRKIAEKYGYFYFQEIFNELIEAVPEIERVYWTQYTPYWNDGETCIFSVNDICYDWNDEVNKIEEFSDDYDGILSTIDTNIQYLEESYKNQKKLESESSPGKYKHSVYILEKIEKSKKLIAVYGIEGLERRTKAVDEFIKFINKIPKDFMLEIFGDHCEVEITRYGVTVEEHSHE